MNTNLYSQFTANSNKGMVWKILCDNRTFEGIPPTKSNLIKEIFDKKISLLAEQINESSDRLVDLNKKVIGEMIVTGNNYKQQQQTPSPSSVPEIYNASALAEQRQQKFQDELSKKQNDFDSLSQVKIPEKPNFSDTLDMPIGSEMDKLLAEQIAMREEQLNSVLNRQNTEEAKKWLELPNNITTQETMMNRNINNNSIVKLKIGDSIKVDLNNNNSQKKQVTFSDALTEQQPRQPSVDPEHFMALLKKKTTTLPTVTPSNTTPFNNNNDITTMLREILANQKQLLALLQTK